MATNKIKLKDGSQNVLHPETETDCVKVSNPVSGGGGNFLETKVLNNETYVGESTYKATDFVPSPSTSGSAGQVLKLDSQGNPVWGDVQSGGASIDDSTTAADKTWSSYKINQQLGTKQNTINNLREIEQGAEAGKSAIQPVSDAIQNNFVAFDAYGSIKDSHKNASNFLPVPSSAGTAGQVLKLGSGGNTVWANEQGGGASIDDSTTADNKTWSSQKINQQLETKQDSINNLSDIISGAEAGETALQPIVDAPEGNFVAFDANGGIEDSGFNSESFAQTDTVDPVVITGEPGTPAAVTNNGSSANPEYQFTIPKGYNGSDAVNPFKGWWPDAQTLKDAFPATAGDFAYVEDSGVWKVYVYDSTDDGTNSYWVDSNDTADPSLVTTFRSSQALSDVAIDNTNLSNASTSDNSNEPTLPKGSDVQILNQKLRGINIEEQKCTLVTFGNGYINTSGVVTGSAVNAHVVVTLESGFQKLRFLGLGITPTGVADTDVKKYSYAFYDANDTLIPDSCVRYTRLNVTETSKTVKKEYVVNIPEDAVTFKCSVGALNRNDFYSYLENGETMKEYIENVNEKFDSLDIYQSEFIDLSSLDGNNFIINPSTLKWNTVADGVCVLMPVAGGEKIQLKTNENGCYIAFLKKTTISNTAAASFATDSTLEFLEKNKIFVREAPANAKCLYITLTMGYADMKPEYVKKYRLSLKECVENIFDASISFVNGVYGDTVPFFLNQNGEWSTSGSTTSSTVAVNGAEYLKIVPNAGGSTIGFFTKLPSSTATITPNFVSSVIQTRVLIYNEQLIKIPSDAAYVYVFITNSSGEDRTPISLKLGSAASKFIPSISGNVTNISENDCQILNAIITSSDTWQKQDTAKSAWYHISAASYQYIDITPNGNCRIAFLKGIPAVPTSVTPASISSYLIGGSVVISEREKLIIPAEATYIYFSYVNTSGLDVFPQNITLIVDSIGSRLFALDTMVRDVPSYTQLNGYKKAHQLTDIVWTPVLAVKKSDSGTFTDDKAVTGAPYSSVKEYRRYITYNVSLRTFMTAVHNQYSLLYTEDVRSTTTSSIWGITYNDPSTNTHAYIGGVCSTLGSYVLGLPINYATADIAYLTEHGVFEKVYDQSANGVKLLDVLLSEGHMGIVTDIYRNNRGVVQAIEVSDWWQPVARTIVYTPSAFNNYLVHGTSGPYTILRYLELYKNIEYNPSDFVAVEDEEPVEYTYNDDISTFLGDYASFREGELVALTYTAGIYTQMQLYKNNALVKTINLDPSKHYVTFGTVSPNATAQYVDGDYILGYGKYKANLIGGINESDFCYFEVIRVNLSVVDNGDGTQTYNYSSNGGTPVGLFINNNYGSNGGCIALSENQTSSYTMNTLEYIQERLNIIHSSNDPTSYSYARIECKGSYGRVCSDFVPWLFLT